MICICKYCNKEYSSYQSRCNHIKKYHLNEDLKLPQITPQNNSKNEGFECSNCNKKLSRQDNLTRHLKKCTPKKINIDEVNALKNEINDLKSTLLNFMKIHPTGPLGPNRGLPLKTLKKINKDLYNVNNGTINNTTNNTNIINIIPLGKEKLNDVLSNEQKLEILKSGNNAHIKLTELIYQKPEYKQMRNVYITNFQDLKVPSGASPCQNDTGYIYDKKKKQYIVKSKNEIINQYSNERFWNIEEFLEKVKEDLDQNEFDKINKLVVDYFNDKKFKKTKNKELLITLYNNKAQVKELYDLIL